MVKFILMFSILIMASCASTSKTETRQPNQVTTDIGLTADDAAFVATKTKEDAKRMITPQRLSEFGFTASSLIKPEMLSTYKSTLVNSLKSTKIKTCQKGSVFQSPELVHTGIMYIRSAVQGYINKQSANPYFGFISDLFFSGTITMTIVTLTEDAKNVKSIQTFDFDEVTETNGTLLNPTSNKFIKKTSNLECLI